MKLKTISEKELLNAALNMLLTMRDERIKANEHYRESRAENSDIHVKFINKYTNQINELQKALAGCD